MSVASNGRRTRLLHGLLAGLFLSTPALAGTTRPLATRFNNPARCAFGHHEIEAALDPETAALRVTDEILLLHPAGVPAGTKTPFLLNRSLRILSIHASTPAATVPVRWEEHQRWEPCDFWERPKYAELANLGHARQVDLYLKDAKAAGGWPESLLIVVSYEGTVYDSLKPPPESYQRGFETTTGLIDPRGAFLSSAALWYPERFDEPFTFRVAAEVPPDWKTVSQGRMVVLGAGAKAAADEGDVSIKKATDAGRASPELVLWESREPMDEIYLIAGPYRLREEDHRGIAIQTFTYGDDDEQLCRQYLDATKDYVDLYSDLIGPYPFSKFAMVENFWQTGYGMPSFTLLGTRVVRLPWIVHTSYGHEILHNWWGNGVFVDWESGNWCEGITVYGADYLYKERESEEAARNYRRTQLQGYLDYVRSGRDFALTEFRARHDASSAAVGYGKAMMIFHMLRRSCGDDLFWGCLSEFYHDFLFERASWTDLLGVFAAHAERDFQEFYHQWISRAGAPLLALATADLTKRPDGKVDLTYKLEQEEPLYTLEVPIRVTFDERPPESWKVAFHEAVFEETRTLPEMPRTLEVDPDFDLFRRLHRAEVPAALSQLFGADSVTVILSTGEPEALEEAYRGIAEASGKAKPTGLISDGELVLSDLREDGVWIMGEPRWMDRLRRLLPEMLEIRSRDFRIGDRTYERSSYTLVLALPHPEARDEAIGLLLGSSPEEAAVIWRKLPHYGKYSYLVFEGTKNVEKGSWPVERSPLMVVWDEGR